MAKAEVKVELSTAQEIALMSRYGRKCSRESLVKRAIAEVLKQEAEDVPVFVSREDAEARLALVRADEETARRAAMQLAPEVEAVLLRFRAGEKLVDEAGWEITALEPSDKDQEEPVIAQFGGDNSEWYPIALSEIESEITWRQKHRGEVLSELEDGGDRRGEVEGGELADGATP